MGDAGDFTPGLEVFRVTLRRLGIRGDGQVGLVVRGGPHGGVVLVLLRGHRPLVLDHLLVLTTRLLEDLLVLRVALLDLVLLADLLARAVHRLLVVGRGRGRGALGILGAFGRALGGLLGRGFLGPV